MKKLKIFTDGSGNEQKLQDNFNKWMETWEKKITIDTIQTAANEYRFVIFVFYKEDEA